LKSPNVRRIFVFDWREKIMAINTKLTELIARAAQIKAQGMAARGNGVSHLHAVQSPAVDGMMLDVALSKVADAEKVLEAARSAARAAARAAGQKVSGLFSGSQFVNRSWAERIADEARAEGHEQGGKETIAMYAKINAPPPAEYKALGDAVRAAVARGELKGWFGKDKGGAPADAADLDAAEAEEQARVEAEAKVRAAAILRAAALRDSGGPPLPEPAPCSKAARIIAAGQKRRRGDY
jgi:hypothetical protein